MTTDTIGVLPEHDVMGWCGKAKHRRVRGILATIAASAVVFQSFVLAGPAGASVQAGQTVPVSDTGLVAITPLDPVLSKALGGGPLVIEPLALPPDSVSVADAATVASGALGLAGVLTNLDNPLRDYLARQKQVIARYMRFTSDGQGESITRSDGVQMIPKVLNEPIWYIAIEGLDAPVGEPNHTGSPKPNIHEVNVMINAVTGMVYGWGAYR